MKPELHIFPTLDEMYRAAAERWIACAGESIAARGSFYVALAGGNSPRPLYERLATPNYRYRVAWKHAYIFFGDERCVPADHPASNYLMAHTALLAPLRFSAARVHRIECEREHDEASAHYAKRLDILPKNAAGAPIFDLLMLGLGNDGHIASLFPGTAVLKEDRRWLAPVYAESVQSWRMSLTLPVLNAAREVMLLTCGSDKADVAARALDPDTTPRLPVQMLAPQGRYAWFMDASAAAKLPR